MGQPADRALARRQRRRQLVEPVDARDLLDQVGRALDVGVAPGGHRHREPAAGAHRDSKPRLSRIRSTSASSIRSAEDAARAGRGCSSTTRGGAGAG